MTTTPLTWFKSSYSGNDGPDCLEAAISPTPHPTVHIRDSKNRTGSRLAFTDSAWSQFLEFATGR
ncbi:DNA-binding protein [Streptomyces viridochromogenes DSM 40736]|uniref:DNA-binding protein n=1 Tax=Streptomyces viridochromogenes (strain DSM 40736 / JCM 4977 / BCRC 1201 / Tue 494) TaxID=591159 RepID=D9XH77_STRVT|nr:DUF397 domain-containing protein [Streptomyces viridochromogenes]EFL32870.1 DNA-binding protein [Streptomyces viridochromogenes DSM 40736]